MSKYPNSPRINVHGDDPSSSSIYLSPHLKNSSSAKLRKLKLKVHLKRTNSSSGTSKLVYSVDDDINEEEEEEARRYLEGFKDALRELIHSDIEEIEEEQQHQHQLQEQQGRQGDEAGVGGNFDGEVLNHDVVPKLDIQNIHDRGGDDGSFEVDNDLQSIKSTTSTVELLNLQQRQNAINSTHPFGIKIWKPSIYKKKRSVATRAEEDIHAYDPRKPNASISWGVILSNCVWSLTVGLFLYIICIVGAIIVFFLSGFAIHRHSRPYVKLLIKLGTYWLFPFSKFVLLNKDKDYLDEDQLDGRSISEFHHWRQEEEGRLFFAPPRRLTTGTESRPLLKDHLGRSMRETYASVGNRENSIDEENATYSSNSSINNVGKNVVVNDSIDQENSIDPENIDIKVRFFGRGSWSSGRLVFYMYFYGILQPIMYLVGSICWLAVFTIPMAKITFTLCDHLRRHPLTLDFEFEKEYYKKADGDSEAAIKKRKHQRIILNTYRSCGLHYYKYTIDGTNIFFINLFPVVCLVILDFYIAKERFNLHTWYTDSVFIFGACLFSVIPLAYFIGQAVASISAQSSMGVGAVINAFFSTIVEIFLYCVALNQSKGKLVEGSMIGSILAGVLLLPGLSMCGGALKRKTQRYNPKSAGVSSTMLLYAMVTMFAPSLFYQIFGAYEVKCRQCFKIDAENDCISCRFVQPGFSLDPLYYEVIRPFSLIVAVALFAAYVCGLFFTLRTHASLIWATNSHEVKKDVQFRSPSLASLDVSTEMASSNLRIPQSAVLKNDPKFKQPTEAQLNSTPATHASALVNQAGPSLHFELTKPSDVEAEKLLEDDDESGGHDAPNWSKTKSAAILLGSTLLYAVIAEILVNTVDEVLENYPINPKFLGLTIFALVPNVTEFLNAISFAISGNVALSLEIGSAYALQVVLLQIPSLVIYSVYKQFDVVEQIFTLIFPRWDIIATFISIYLFTYIYAEGKSNYFKGFILILIYFVVMIGFWFNDKIELLDDGYNDGPALTRTVSKLLGA